MVVMTIGTNNLEEEMATIKAMLEHLVKENEEKEACIKLHEEKIARLTRKLEKSSQFDPSKKGQKVRRRGTHSSKVKLSTRRSTQRTVANSRMMGLQT